MKTYKVCRLTFRGPSLQNSPLVLLPGELVECDKAAAKQGVEEGWLEPVEAER